MSKKDEVKAKVTIPMYFYNIIVPQLGSYYAVYEVNFESKPVACCPLHDEDTPSMRYYEETNTFYCFGCRRGGDIITLHREFTERQTGTMPSLDESVEFLYSYFIKGNEYTQAVRTTTSLLNRPKSSTVELARYCNYTEVLEKQLSADKYLKQDVKTKIWEALDLMDILVDKNEVGAIQAMDYIKQIVRETIT